MVQRQPNIALVMRFDLSKVFAHIKASYKPDIFVQAGPLFLFTCGKSLIKNNQTKKSYNNALKSWYL